MNDPQSCDSVSGECLRCLNNAYGEACGLCAPGFFGDAVHWKDCQSCHCDQCGTAECSSFSGQCTCQPNVVGEKCDRCQSDHFGFNTCQGCRSCDCAAAAEGSQCDDNTGQCRCRPGTTGRSCERCTAGFWNYGAGGCQSCNCNSEFSIGASCNPHTGQCECLPGVIGDKCETCPYRWALIPDSGCIECTSCNHNLLDVTDDLSRMVNPVVHEFQAAALSYFTHQKLASLNQTASNLLASAQQLDLSSVQFGPLENATAMVEALSRNLHIKVGYVEAETLEKTAVALQSAANATAMEHQLQEIVKNAYYVVDEVFLLSESLEGGAGPQIEKSLDEAYNILQEIQLLDFNEYRTQVNTELLDAVNLLTDMNRNALPVQDNHQLIANLTMRLQDFISRVIDLNSHMEQVKNNARQAERITLENRASSSLGAVDEIQQRNESINAHLSGGQQKLIEAAKMLDSAQKSLEQLSIEIERLRNSKKTIGYQIDIKVSSTTFFIQSILVFKSILSISINLID